MIYCRYCGKSLIDAAKFCTKCGKPVLQNKQDPDKTITDLPKSMAAGNANGQQSAASAQGFTPVQPAAPAQGFTPVQPAVPAQGFTPVQPAAPVQSASAFQAAPLQPAMDYSGYGMQAAGSAAGEGETTVLKRDDSTGVQMNAPAVTNLLRLKSSTSDEEMKIENKMIVRVGRNAGNDIQLNDNLISGYHASFEWDECEWLLMDESRNGTTIDGVQMQRGKKYALEPGNVISFATAISFTYMGCEPDEKPYVSPFEGISDEKEAVAALKNAMAASNDEKYLNNVFAESLMYISAYVPVKYHGIDPYGNIVTKTVCNGVNVNVYTDKNSLAQSMSLVDGVKLDAAALIKFLYSLKTSVTVNLDDGRSYSVNSEVINALYEQMNM